MVTPIQKAKQNHPAKEAHGICNPLSKRLYTLKEAAEYLGRSEWGMRELVWTRKIPVVRQEGGRKIFVDILDLMEFIEKNKSTYN
jgi:excisionase family DNA binding protein